ncbi:MFS transporter [Litchfieldia salsa]|uniref:Predicted arabinose efflux permease, MFS family n=1 Tax=Litchfieldia salsa TaxID=930152 RepID=A0A1H0RW41_9BACI|nr:MFS transporter [Litchfieldia salsa]SDP33226.1 Predicted arabinose efflux permease, MFS family [Litchfieldia salsa]
MNRKLILYVKALSDFGTFMDLIVLNVVIYAATGSPLWLAAAMAARTIGGVLSSLFSGVVADRFDRRKIMIYTDILRAIIILALIPFPSPTFIIIASFLIGLTSTFFGVSFSAEIPRIFGENRVLETNAIIARLTSISLVAGFIAAGVITDFLGYKITLIIDASTYLVSALVLVKMKWETAIPRTDTALTSGAREKIMSVMNDLKEVYKYLSLAPMLMMINVVFLVGSFAGSSHNLGIPLLAENLDAERQGFYYGMIWGVWGIGSVLATMILPRLRWLLDQKLYWVCFSSAILMSTGFIIFLSTSFVWIIFPFAFFTGIFDACFTTLHATILQKTENHIRGRIFGVGMLLKSLGFALGFILAPLLLERMTMPNMVWILHGTLIITTIIITCIAFHYHTKKVTPQVTKEI